MRVLVKGQIKTKLALHSNILRLQKAAVAVTTAAKGQAAVSILILGTGRHQLGGGCLTRPLLVSAAVETSAQ